MIATVLATLAGTLAVIGGVFFVVTSVAMFRARDALTRLNLMTPATGVGLPLVLLAALVHEVRVTGFSWPHALEVAIAIVALMVVSSVASFTMGRAIHHSDAPRDPRTRTH